LLVHLANTAHDRQPQSADSLTITLSTALRSGSVVLSFRYEVGHSVPDTAPAEAESGTADRSDSPLAAAQVMARAHGAVITGLRREPPAVGLELAVPVGTHVILLIDDNPYVGNLFRRMLATSHYDLVHARTASRALSMARETPPQGIILDVVMPTRDGWEILTALKLDRRTAAIPVIVCSVLPDRELALSLGASDFLAKPVTRATLRTALDRALQSRPHPLLSDV
ncbi:MAG TPA: response regulator, partial [Chloroflexota bacterium]|nr:response regulator [Chloroflexota bacterium]